MSRTLFAISSLLPFLFASVACGTDPTCVAGRSSCACEAGAGCDEGLVCDTAAGICRPPRTLRLPAIDPTARSCELLLEDDAGATVVSARFDASARGEHVREAPRTAIAFHAMSDAPIGRDAVRVEVLGEGDFRIVNAQCFDRDGEPISGGGIATDG